MYIIFDNWFAVKLEGDKNGTFNNKIEVVRCLFPPTKSLRIQA